MPFPSTGIFVALALRFDVSRGEQKCYFNSAFFGYTLGLVVTIVVMNWFQAAQVNLLCHLSQYLFLCLFVLFVVILGLTFNICCMLWLHHLQPALLYIVPGVIGSVAVHCLWNGEVKPVCSLSCFSSVCVCEWVI